MSDKFSITLDCTFTSEAGPHSPSRTLRPDASPLNHHSIDEDSKPESSNRKRKSVSSFNERVKSDDRRELIGYWMKTKN